MTKPLWKFTPILKGEHVFLAIVNEHKTFNTQIWMFQQVLAHIEDRENYNKMLTEFLRLVHMKAMQISELQLFRDAAHHALPDDLK